jgi:putative acetyltransferase
MATSGFCPPSAWLSKNAQEGAPIELVYAAGFTIGYPMLSIIQGDLRDPRVVNLVHCHLTRARAETAPGSAHALDLVGLESPDISFWTVWDDDKLLGIGALKQLSIDHCEIKSMYTAQSARRKGVGRTMLRHIIATARKRGVWRLSLETGSWDYFEPARALYRSHGFVECPPFADYVPDPNSIFMTLDLRALQFGDAR